MSDIAVVDSLPISKVDVVDSGIHVAYVWKTGRNIYLSKTRKLIADTYISTRNYQACCDIVLKECKRELSISTVKRWLGLPDIMDYISERFEKEGYWNGMDEKYWNMVMVKHMNGQNKLNQVDLYCMNLLARYRGFGNGSGFNQNNIAINITQSNGKE